MTKPLLHAVMCPNGCDQSFIQYETWKGGSDRAVRCTHVLGRANWSMFLRCGDCGLRYGRDGVSAADKDRLDKLMLKKLDEMTGMEEQFDQQIIERDVAFRTYLKENNRL